jgi:hypothetical protein
MATKKASKKKVTKAAMPGSVVTRRVNVPTGTRQINLEITIGKPGHKMGFKMAKSEIKDDPLGGGG